MITSLMLSGPGVRRTISLSTNWAPKIMFWDPDAVLNPACFADYQRQKALAGHSFRNLTHVASPCGSRAVRVLSA